MSYLRERFVMELRKELFVSRKCCTTVCIEKMGLSGSKNTLRTAFFVFAKNADSRGIHMAVTQIHVPKWHLGKLEPKTKTCVTLALDF